MGQGRQWTQEDIEYLRENYGKHSYVTLAKNLNRTVNAIKNRVTRLQLGAFLQNGEYITFEQLLIALGYCKSGSSYKRISWIKNRGFPVYKKKVENNSFYVVFIDDFWEWAEKNQDLLDFSNFEENVLGKEQAWVKAKRKRDYEKKRKYRMTPWTRTEDAELKRLVIQQKYTYAELSRKMNRTCGAIQRRLSDLGIKDRPLKADTTNKWSQEEYRKLGELIQQGYDYNLISEQIERSSKAIRGVVYRYYLTENLDKVRAYMGTGAFGDNCPTKQLKNYKVMDTEDRREVRNLLSELTGILRSVEGSL